MIDKSLERNFSTKEDERRKASYQILKILDKFIISKQDLLRNPPSKYKSSLLSAVMNNRWGGIYFCLTIFFTFSLFVLFLSEISNNVIAKLILYGILLSMASFAIYLIYKSFKSTNRSFKEIREKSIHRATRYNFQAYYRIIEDLGESFYEEDLSLEETRFKVTILERQRISKILNKANPLLSILLVIISIVIIGYPDKNKEISLFYGTVANISGIVFIVKVSLDIYLEILDRDINIYEKCVLILQKAQVIAREAELDDIRVYDEAIKSEDEAISLEQAISEIEGNC